MCPGRMGSPSSGWTALSLLARLRIWGRMEGESADRWMTTKTGDGKSAGKADTTRTIASTPPDDAPRTTMSCGGIDRSCAGAREPQGAGLLELGRPIWQGSVLREKRQRQERRVELAEGAHSSAGRAAGF